MNIMPKKGNCYKAATAVKEALAKCGWTTGRFFKEAKGFNGTNGFDAVAEAMKFDAYKEALSEDSGCIIPHAVVAFADWILVKDIKDIRERFP